MTHCIDGRIPKDPENKSKRCKYIQTIFSTNLSTSLLNNAPKRRNHIPGHFGVHGLSMAGLIIRDEASPRGPRGREVFCVFCFFSGFSPKIQVLSAGLQVGSEI